MKHLIFMYLFIGVAIFYFGCSDNNPSGPDLNDEISTSLAKEKTSFSGTSTKVGNLSTGTFKTLPNGKTLYEGIISVYTDIMDDPRVSGISTWYVSGKVNSDGSEDVRGKADLIVDNDGGKWEMTWHGTVSPDGSIVDYVVGTGKEGAVKGLVAKWTYIREPGQAGFYSVTGYINEK